MFRLIMKSCFLYIFLLLFLFLIHSPKSFAGLSGCGDDFCQALEDNCLDTCNTTFGCQWCPDSQVGEQCVSDEGSCPPPPSITKTFSQVGGIANSNPSDDWCCSFFANVCAPCGNPALGYSYQMPNACDGAIQYENLWVRCQDSDCNGLTTGSYEVRLCHFDSQDPSSGRHAETHAL